MLNITGAQRRTVLVVALCGLVVFLGSNWHAAVANSARIAGGAAAQPSAVAVIDLNRVLEGLAEYQEVTQRIMKDAEAGQRGLDEINARMRQLDQELENLRDRTSQAWVNNRLERTELESLGKTRVEILRHRLELATGESMRAIYTKISSSVKRLGESDGWHIIMLDDRDLLPEPKRDRLVTGADMNQYVVNRRILYVSGSADITDQLVTMMNNEYKAARR